MDLFSKIMAVFWSMAEGLIFIYMRWGYLALEKRNERQPVFKSFSIVLFLFLIILIFFGETILSDYLDLEQVVNRTTYQWALWNFFCTLWVVLEGVIMIYVYRIYRHLKSLSHMGTEDQEDSRLRSRRFLWGIFVLVALLFLLYFLYQYDIFYMIENHGISPKQIYRISVLYIRVCGFFWITFECVVAILGIKSLIMLKKEMGQAYGNI